MSRLSLVSRPTLPPHPIAGSAEVPVSLFLLLVYVALTSLFVFQWARTTAEFNAVDSAAFADESR
jgi:hypothetical protein